MSNLTQDQIFLLTLNDTRTKLLYYSCLTIIPAGITLNIISSLIFTRKRFKKNTMGFYNIAISMFNNILAIFGMVTYFSQAIGKDLSLVSDFSCLFLSFSMRLFTQMSTWMNVFVTVDRMVSITYPNRFPVLKNKYKLSLLIFVQFLFICVINIPNLLFKVVTIKTVNPVTNATIITKTCTSSESIVKARDIIVLIFRMALPIFLMITMNIYLMRKLIQEKTKFKRLTELNKEYHFAFSIFFMNVLYTLLLLPNFGAVVYLNIIQYASSAQIGTRDLIVAQFVFAIGVVVASYEFFFTIFVNLLFNKLFKKEFIIFLKQLVCLEPINFVKDSSNMGAGSSNNKLTRNKKLNKDLSLNKKPNNLSSQNDSVSQPKSRKQN